MKRIWSAFRSAALLLLLVAATGCSEKSSPLVDRSELTVNSGESVRVIAIEGADEYLWRGVDDTEGISFNTEGKVLEFTAPVVQKRHTALFELEAKFRFFTQKQNVKVVIEPVEDENTDGSDGNLTAPATDDGGDTSIENNASTEDGVSIKSLTLHVAQTSLNRDHNITVTLTAKYKDNTAKTLTEGIAWIITPKDAVSVKGDTLTALKDGNVTIQAWIGNTLSNIVKLNIYWEVSGHRLPPEPDPEINNATLLGVDVNHNGVRDDVERWIYKTYEQPAERGIMLQDAYAFQKVIVNPKKAHETVKYINDSLACFYYLLDTNSYILTKYRFQDIDRDLMKIQFNTIKRHTAYERFNGEFNGEVFSTQDANKSKCTFDINGNLKALP